MSLRALLAIAVGVAVSACSDPVSLDPSGARAEVVVTGLDAPVYVTAAPGDPSRLYVVEKPGRIRVVRDGELVAQPFLDITASTSSGGERGLLGLAFDPDFATNRFLFVNHTNLDGDTRILRYTASSADQADVASVQVVLEVGQPYSNHNGGHLAFGPDGMLYIGLGDGGSGGDPEGNGQNRATLLGSMLRIDVSSIPYTVPADNPFVGAAGVAPEIFAYGLRNPWRYSFDGATGELWIGDVGQNQLEEISWATLAVARGGNFGWAIREGTACYRTDPCESAGLIGPLHEYDHAEGCSVTGGYVYRGQAFPSLIGRYFYADFCDGWVRSFRRDGDVAIDHYDHSADLGTIARIASFGEDLDGELYIVSLAGSVYRVTAPE